MVLSFPKHPKQIKKMNKDWCFAQTSG